MLQEYKCSIEGWSLWLMKCRGVQFYSLTHAVVRYGLLSVVENLEFHN